MARAAPRRERRREQKEGERWCNQRRLGQMLFGRGTDGDERLEMMKERTRNKVKTLEDSCQPSFNCRPLCTLAVSPVHADSSALHQK